MKTRRIWKKTFRYVRIYLPLVLTLLVAMVVFLPISGRWLTRKAQDQAASRLGVDVELRHLEVVISQARVQARGVTLPAAKPGGEPFTVDRVVADGELRGLIAGDDRWPARVVIDSPSPLRFRRDGQEDYHLTGPILTLIDTVQSLANKPKEQPAGGSGPGKPKPPSSGRTPELILRNFDIEVEEPTADWPPLVLRIDECHIDERSSATAPVHATLRGVATAMSTEKFNLTLDFIPGQKRVALEGDLSAIMVPFFIPQLGQFSGRVRNMKIDFDGAQEETGEWTGALTMEAGRFDVRRETIGGEHWSDSPLEIRIRAGYNPANNLVRLSELSLNGNQIEVMAKGEVFLRRDLAGEAELSIQRLPAAALALGRSELLDRLGIEVTPMETSPTLRLEARAKGSFAQPKTLDSEVSVRLGGWRLNAGKLPDAVELENLDAVISDERITMNDLSLKFGAMTLSAHADVPVSDPAKPEPGQLIVEASGPSDAAFDLLSRLRLAPAEVTSFDAPIRLDAMVALLATREPGKNTLQLAVEPGDSEATLSWREGRLGLRRVLEPLKLEAGLIRYTSGRVDVERLGVAVNSLTVSASGSASGGSLMGKATGKPFEYKGRVTAGGNLSDLLFYLGHEVRLPTLPPDLDGQFQVELFATGDTSNPAATDYDAKLFLTDIHASIPTRWRQVVIKDLDTQIKATPHRVEIPSLKVVLGDDQLGDSTAELKLVLDDRHARLEATARTTLQYIASVLAKDLSDLHVAGVVPAVGWAEAVATKPLPPGPDVIRRWIAATQEPGFRVGLDDTASVKVNYEGLYQPESPLEVTPRDFPVRMENIRGNATFSPKGLQFTAVRADIGSAKDVEVKALVELVQPTRITFELSAAKLDLNEWMSGWGERPWASKPVSYTPKWTLNPNPQQFVEINGRIAAKEIRFLQFTGSNVTGDLEFEAWSRRRTQSQLWVRNIKANVYDGDTSAGLEFGFVPGQRPFLHTDAEFQKVNLQTFMDDLLERRQSFDGNLDGGLTFDGQLLNYPTYTGRGHYLVTESSFVGRIILQYAGNLMQMTSKTGGRDTTIRGTVSMADQKVFMPDLDLVSPAVNITADGYVDFRGRLFYDITASVISKQLKNIPIVSIVGNLWDTIGKEVVSYQLRGTIKKPENKAVPTLVKHAGKITELFRESREKFAPASEKK